MHLAVVVLAAGKGTRMKSDLPKVLHRACGRSLIGWALAAAEPLDADETEIMQRHPEIGAKVLENLEGLSERTRGHGFRAIVERAGIGLALDQEVDSSSTRAISTSVGRQSGRYSPPMNEGSIDSRNIRNFGSVSSLSKASLRSSSLPSFQKSVTIRLRLVPLMLRRMVLSGSVSSQ